MISLPTLNLLFEKKQEGSYTSDARMYHDMIRYYSKIGDESKPFSLRQLQKWLIENNQDIIQSFQDFAGKTTLANRIKAKRDQIERRFKTLIDLGLIRSVSGSNKSSSLYTDKKFYVFTESGILIWLILKSMNLKGQIKMEKERKHVLSLTAELNKNNKKIYDVIDSSLPIGDNHPYSNIYYKELYRKINDEGVFDKLVSHIISLCDNNIRLIPDMEHLLLYALEFDFECKHDRKRFLHLQTAVIEKLPPDVKDIVLYEIKLSIERKFQMSRRYLSREYEKQCFRSRANHKTIILEGCCEKCRQYSIVRWSYAYYKEKQIELHNNNIRYHCPKCKIKFGCIIPVF
jgi:hypothetical protein